jgi:hypothetical protein
MSVHVSPCQPMSVHVSPCQPMSAHVSPSLSPRHGASSSCEWRNGLQKKQVTANVLNWQSRTADKAWSFSLWGWTRCWQPRHFVAFHKASELDWLFGTTHLNTGTDGGLLWMWWWTSRFHKMAGISGLAEDRLASQEGLCYIELVVIENRFSQTPNTAMTWYDMVWYIC